ncbi:hypothetical protein JCM10908_002135 [Rhodotorula pacifica]|uniref:uncharacterized protein n=1 Tax=Rhodotorula pacifica TaxID=1495444 RepID=UPI00317F9584
MSTVVASPSTHDRTGRDGQRHKERHEVGLAGDEVLQLTTFAEKKAWIDDKIQFLSSLPEVKVSEPEPPTSPTMTSLDLETWWEEHDRIEREIDEYDMGDLAKMRQFAREKSKQALSPRDTDLIEITLTTLFSVDKLLHLLRHRRRALTLLRYRLQWEESTVSAWKQYRRVVDRDLPSFLQLAQAAHHSTASQQSSTIAASPSLSDLSASLRSLSASTSSRDLASSAGASSSNRTQLFQLARTTLTTNARTLSSSLVPAAGAALDKLIDASSAPLPESFLDAQDRLEDAVSSLGDELDRFAVEVVQQAEMAGIVRAALDDFQCAALSLVEEARPSAPDTVPTRETHRDLLARLDGLQARLDEIQDQLRALPRPRHPAVPSQAEHTTSLLAELDDKTASSRSTLSDAYSAACDYERKLEVYTNARITIDALRATRDRLDVFLASPTFADITIHPESILVNGRPDTSYRRQIATDYAECEARVAKAKDDLQQVQTLCRQSAKLVNAIRDVGLAPSLRKELRSSADDLRAKADQATSLLERTAPHRLKIREVLDWSQDLERCLVLVEKAESSAEERLRLTLWREGSITVEADDTLSQLVASVDFAFTDLSARRARYKDANNMNTASNLVDPRRSLSCATDDLQARVRTLKARESLVQRANEQSRAIVQAVEALASLRRRTSSIMSRAVDIARRIDGSPGSRLAQLENEIADVERGFDETRGSLHTRVPFLSSVPSFTASGIDLEAHDANTRLFLNELCISIAGEIEAARRVVTDLGTHPSSSTTEATSHVAHPEEQDVPVEEKDSELSSTDTLGEPTAPSTPPAEGCDAPAISHDPLAVAGLDLSTTPALEGDHSSVLRLPDDGAPKRFDDLFSPETGSIPVVDGERMTSSEWLAPLEEPRSTTSLRQRLHAISACSWLSPNRLRLPTSSDIEAVVEELAACTSTFEDLLARSSSTDPEFVWTDVGALREDFENAKIATDRLRRLAAVADNASQADRVLSKLLDYIDSAPSAASDRRANDSESPLATAEEALSALRQATLECADDLRVKRTLERVESTHGELLELLARPRKSGIVTDTGRYAALPSNPVDLLPEPRRPADALAPSRDNQRAMSAQSSRSSSRASISTTPRRVTAPVSASTTNASAARSRRPSAASVSRDRARDASSQTTRSTVAHPFSFDRVASPVASRDRTSLVTSTRRALALRTSSRSSRGGPEDATSANSILATPSRRTSHRTPGTLQLPENTRCGDISSRKATSSKSEGNKLDRAVSMVAKAMPFVTIEIAEGRWTDESGVYTIGDRLCFCRLLRSKQVMVRVGGGWLELSQFILTHFGTEATVTLSPVNATRAHILDVQLLQNASRTASLAALIFPEI